MNNFSIALQWVKSQNLNNPIFADKLLEPFSIKEGRKLLTILSKTHYVWPMNKKYGAVLVDKNCKDLTVAKKDGAIAGFINKEDSIMMLPAENFVWLKQF